MKRLSAMLMLTAAMVIISACQSENSGNKEEATTPYSVADEIVNTKEIIPEHYGFVTDRSDFTEVKENQNYNIETDCQYYDCYQIGNRDDEGITESVDAIFIYERFLDDTIIYTFDKETEAIQYFCNKPECNHDSEECNAYFYKMKGCFYYEGYLYYILQEEIRDSQSVKNGTIEINMYRELIETQRREKVGTIANAVISSDEVYDYNIEGAVHRGYFYYVYEVGTGGESAKYYNNGSNSIYRVSLDDVENKECIANLERNGAWQFVNMQGIGSYIYYMLPDYEGMGEVYRFNTESLKSEAMSLGTIAAENFVIWNGYIYYKKDWRSNDIYKRNPDTGEETLFINTEKTGYEHSSNIHADENYLYVACYNGDMSVKEKYYVAFNSEGNNMASIIEEDYATNMGGKDYMVALNRPEGVNTRINIYMLDKKLIGGENYNLVVEKVK